MAKHVRPRHERTTPAFDLGAAHAAPRHRLSGYWKLIAQTPRYTLHEHTETHETRTTWDVNSLYPAQIVSAS